MLAALVIAAVFTRPLERVASMDPAFCTSVYDSHAVQLVYETPLLIDYEARPYRLVPGYCELPETSPDGLRYRFRTLHGPARDMVSSLERLRDPAIVSPNGWYLKYVDTISAAEENLVEIRMKSRQHVFPWIMAMSGAGIRRPDGSGTGPYELVSWRRNHEMVFRRKRASEDGFDTVRYLVIDDASTQWLMFLKGELDFMGEISRDSWDALLGDAGAALLNGAGGGPRYLKEADAYLHTIPTLEMLYIGFNMRDPVVGTNRALRQALNCAFDYPVWEKFYSGRITEAGGPVPSSVAGALPPETFPYRFDLDRARRLLAEAGYPDGIDPMTGRRLVLTLAQGRASQDSREAGELIASFYEKLGVKLESRFYTWEAFLKAVNEGRVQLYRMGWVGDYPDAENFLQLFHSTNVSPGANHSCYVNPAFDRAYDAAMTAKDEDERNRCWGECQRIVREDCPWVFTHVNRATSLVKPRVGSYIPGDFPYGTERFYRLKKKGTE